MSSSGQTAKIAADTRTESSAEWNLRNSSLKKQENTPRDTNTVLEKIAEFHKVTLASRVPRTLSESRKTVGLSARDWPGINRNNSENAAPFFNQSFAVEAPLTFPFYYGCRVTLAALFVPTCNIFIFDLIAGN